MLGRNGNGYAARLPATQTGWNDADRQGRCRVCRSVPIARPVQPRGQRAGDGTHGWSNVTLLWRDLHAPTSDFVTLTDGLEALFSVEEADGALYMLTDWEAPRYRVLRASLAALARANWRELIPEGPHAL